MYLRAGSVTFPTSNLLPALQFTFRDYPSAQMSMFSRFLSLECSMYLFYSLLTNTIVQRSVKVISEYQKWWQML